MEVDKKGKVEDIEVCAENTLTALDEEEIKSNLEEPTPPDGGYGWVVTIASGFVIFFVLGNFYVFGVLYPVYLDVFNAPQGDVVWVGSISAGLMSAAGMFVGALSDYYGNDKLIFTGAILIAVGYILASYGTALWHLYLTEGLIVGVGFCCCFISCLGAVGPWFSHRRGLALGIAFAGAGLGQLVFSFVTQALLDSYGWRGTLRALALIDGVGIATASLFIKRFPPLVPHLSLNGAWHMFSDNRFRLLYAGIVINGLGCYFPLIYVITYAKAYDVSTSQAVLINAIGGVASLLGRALSGRIGDSCGQLLTFRILMITASITTYCWLACTDFASIFIYALVYAFLAGGVMSLVPAVCGEVFGTESSGSTMGLLMSAQAIGNWFSSPIGGVLYDGTGGYFWSIVVSATLLLTGGILLCFLDLPLPTTTTTTNNLTATATAPSSQKTQLSQQQPQEEEQAEEEIEEGKDQQYDNDNNNDKEQSGKKKNTSTVTTTTQHVATTTTIRL